MLPKVLPSSLPLLLQPKDDLREFLEKKRDRRLLCGVVGLLAQDAVRFLVSSIRSFLSSSLLSEAASASPARLLDVADANESLVPDLSRLLVTSSTFF